LDKINKKELSETDICDLFITPAIKEAGWDPIRQIRREVTLTPGPVIVRGNMSSRNKKKKKFADYVLYQEPGVPIAVVEAKDNNHTVSQGMQQALGYAEILEVPSAFSLMAMPLPLIIKYPPPERILRPNSRLNNSHHRKHSGNAISHLAALKTNQKNLYYSPITQTAPEKKHAITRLKRLIGLLKLSPKAKNVC